VHARTACRCERAGAGEAGEDEERRTRRTPESDGRKEAGEQTRADLQMGMATTETLLDIALANALAHMPRRQGDPQARFSRRQLSSSPVAEGSTPLNTLTLLKKRGDQLSKHSRRGGELRRQMGCSGLRPETVVSLRVISR
jgi:hypothetical protein